MTNDQAGAAITPVAGTHLKRDDIESVRVHVLQPKMRFAEPLRRYMEVMWGSTGPAVVVVVVVRSVRAVRLLCLRIASLTRLRDSAYEPEYVRHGPPTPTL